MSNVNKLIKCLMYILKEQRKVIYMLRYWIGRLITLSADSSKMGVFTLYNPMIFFPCFHGESFSQENYFTRKECAESQKPILFGNF
jgi:hypothetical protein